MKKTLQAAMILFLIALFFPQTALAHGVTITQEVKKSIEITATYDTGEPLGEAEVSVFAPDNAKTPWLTGLCDAEGRFLFTPDFSKSGSWAIQVRKAGHGGLVHIEVGAEGVTTQQAGYTPLQLAVMVIAVLWGLTGTALFFKRRKS